MSEAFLHRKLADREAQHAFRRLRQPEGKTDFCSNDYLGIATNGLIEKQKMALYSHGSGGSRLLAGNYPLVEEVEKEIALFHNAAAGLIFNSGYDANLGLLSAVPQRGDTILYDSLSHASIRDGIRLSFAHSQSFVHNDLEDLARKLARISSANNGASLVSKASPPAATSAAPGPAHSIDASTSSDPTIFVVTESVFSMDGDQAPLAEMVALCSRYNAHLIVDEAHATGVVGPRGEGLLQTLGLESQCFARVHTFGKAVGCHGAIVLGSAMLRDYLINFARAFIYTTALPPASVAAIRAAYTLFPAMHSKRAHLTDLIHRFQQAPFDKLPSLTPIQGVVVPGNENIRSLAASLQEAGLDVRPILYPTVPKGSERLRIVLHAYNTFEELDRLISLLHR